MTQSIENLPYVISTREALWGATLIAVTMLLHGAGMAITSRASRAMQRRISSQSSFFSGGPMLVAISWMIVATHIADVLVWGAFLAWRGALPNLSTANYYALLQYTTVGSGIPLPYKWRLLGGALPMAGMLTFAWSTAVLLRVVTEFEDAQSRRMNLRTPPATSAPDRASISQ